MKSFLVAARQPRRHLSSLAELVLNQICRRVEYGTLRVEAPSGNQLEFVGREGVEQHAVWQLRNWRPLWALLARGSIGLAESWLDGDWQTTDLPALLQVAAANERSFGAAGSGLMFSRWYERIKHRLRANSRRQAQRNIAYHYDLGNRFYAAWLDPSMTYSAALFAHPDDTLAAAQQRKYQRLADLVALEPGAEVLEIGCGWGGFLEYAARERGARITGVSISREQCAYAEQRLAAAGLDAQAQVAFRDYRDLDGRYAHIISIEMFEAVGEAYWDSYATQLKRLLAPGGIVGLQTITIDAARFDDYRVNPDFIQRYIFPGGMLPSLSVLEQTLARAGLQITDCMNFGLDYARTLVAWRQRFDAAWPAFTALGFDERFRRMWHFYLAYSEAGFRERAVDVVQLRIEHAA